MPSSTRWMGELGVASQQFVHQALEIGREMLDDHERQAGVFRDVIEEMLDGFQPARRRADADDILSH